MSINKLLLSAAVAGILGFTGGSAFANDSFDGDANIDFNDQQTSQPAQTDSKAGDELAGLPSVVREALEIK